MYKIVKLKKLNELDAYALLCVIPEMHNSFGKIHLIKELSNNPLLFTLKGCSHKFWYNLSCIDKNYLNNTLIEKVWKL